MRISDVPSQVSAAKRVTSKAKVIDGPKNKLVRRDVKGAR
jgi:hypothetical protein